MWIKTDDGSIIDDSGRVKYFSTQRFVEDICFGNCCFVCGSHPDEKPFNNEHVLPEWLLRRFKLFSRNVNLSNDAGFRYDRFTIPCCVDCNTLMGVEIERPISQIVEKGSDEINRYLREGGLLNFYVWMALIFLKAHLKDKDFRLYLDARKGSEKISDLHEWEELHHLHTVARCFYTDSYVSKEALGSFLSLPVRQEVSPERFDFADLTSAQTMLLRLDDVALIAVFNDSGGAMNFFEQKLQRISGPVSELQAREIMAELAFLNLHIKRRASFRSEIDLAEESCRILAKRPPQIELADLDYGVRGALLDRAVGHAASNICVEGHSQEEVLEAIKTGVFYVSIRQKWAIHWRVT